MAYVFTKLSMGAACSAVFFLLSSCASAQTSSEGSLAAPGVLECAEISAFGSVAALDASGQSLSVQFETSRWVTPGAGGPSISFTVDPADRSWKVGAAGLLVLKDGSPPLLLGSAQAEEVETSWDGVNNPDSENCSSA